MTRAIDQASRLGELFRDWQLPLRRFLAHRGSRSAADIDDIAQEVFLRLLRYDRAEFVEDPQSYLFKMAVNVSSEWATRLSRRLPHDSAWLTELVDALSPEVELQRDHIDEQLEGAVNQLRPRAREILRLHFGEGMTHAAIASKLGLTRKTIKREMARAYAQLRRQPDL